MTRPAALARALQLPTTTQRPGPQDSRQRPERWL